jgi:hypothetical protein
MSYLVLVLLSVLWLGFFVPSLLQARRTSSPYTSASTFQDSLRRIATVPEAQGQAPAPPLRPRPRPVPGTARRRDLLAVLLAAVAAGVVVMIGFDGPADWAAVPPAVVLCGYVVLLRRDARRRTSARRESLSAMPVAIEDEAPHVPTVEPSGGVVIELDAIPIVPSVRRRDGALGDAERIAG